MQESSVIFFLIISNKGNQINKAIRREYCSMGHWLMDGGREHGSEN